MLKKRNSSHTFRSKLNLYSIFICFFAILLVGRLFYLQVLEHEQYKLLANKNRIRIRPMFPQRGKIVANDGTSLVFDTVSYRLVVNSESSRAFAEDIKNLALEKGYPEFSNLSLLKHKNRSLSLIIKSGLSWSTAKEYTDLLNRYKSLKLEPYYIREYSMGKELAHVLGYLSKSSEPIFNAFAEYKVGKMGLEYFFNDQLSGKFGVYRTEVNARGKSIRDLPNINKTEGVDLKSTIDSKLQSFVFKTLSEQKAASCVVMDIQSGGILAMVSVPSFDPIKISTDSEYWKKVSQDPLSPIVNKAISGVYPPASTFKPIVALAGLKAGVIDENTKFFCSGHITIQNHTYHCWNRSGHGLVNLKQAIAKSCDVYFFNLALKLSLSDIIEQAKAFGLGVKTDVELPFESSGSIPNTLTSYWNKRYTAQKVLISIGQGQITTTPMQLCVVAAIIAADGKKITPTIVKETNSEKQKVEKYLNIPKDHIKLIKNAMFNVCNISGSSAYVNGHNAEYPMSGKTGTSQVVSLSDKRSKLWQYKDHALFIGYAPSDKPKYAIAVVVDHGCFGSVVAVPIARKIFDYLSTEQ